VQQCVAVRQYAAVRAAVCDDSAAVCGSESNSVWQCERQCVAVRQCVTVRAAVMCGSTAARSRFGSTCSNVRQCGSVAVWQSSSVVVCGSMAVRQCTAVCSSVRRQCAWQCARQCAAVQQCGSDVRRSVQQCGGVRQYGSAAVCTAVRKCVAGLAVVFGTSG
jgi:hypothetical protein